VTVSRVVITGRVQGVGFRHWLASEARKLALTGWVRNRHDGSVEAVFSGKDDDVQQMVQACHSGPRLAVVRDVMTSPAEDEHWQAFSVRPDA
jgi:acylphosphatase